MKDMFTKYRLQMVKETEIEYDCGQVNREISGPDQLNSLLIEVMEMDKEAEEVFVLVTVDTKNNVTGLFEVSRGNLSFTLVHPREVFKRALMMNAASIFVAHNHPTGEVEASVEDIKITKRIKDAGSLMGIELLDHIIIGSNKEYVSLRQNRLINWDESIKIN